LIFAVSALLRPRPSESVTTGHPREMSLLTRAGRRDRTIIVRRSSSGSRREAGRGLQHPGVSRAARRVLFLLTTSLRAATATVRREQRVDRRLERERRRIMIGPSAWAPAQPRRSRAAIPGRYSPASNASRLRIQHHREQGVVAANRDGVDGGLLTENRLRTLTQSRGDGAFAMQGDAQVI
jgi:hypothetical protein